jgi:hypothetical protein
MFSTDQKHLGSGMNLDSAEPSVSDTVEKQDDSQSILDIIEEKEGMNI